MDGAATVLARWRLPEGIAGIAQLHQLIGGLLGEDAGDSEVRVGIETDHGPAGDGRDRGGVPGVPGEPAAVGPVPGPAPGSGRQERDAGDPHVRADMVRACSRQRELPSWSGHAGDDRVALIDTRDVADVVAAILAEGPGIAGTVRAKAPFPSEASWRRAAGPRVVRGWHGA
jgi:hypothetical protein